MFIEAIVSTYSRWPPNGENQVAPFKAFSIFVRITGRRENYDPNVITWLTIFMSLSYWVLRQFLRTTNLFIIVFPVYLYCNMFRGDFAVLRSSIDQSIISPISEMNIYKTFSVFLRSTWLLSSVASGFLPVNAALKCKAHTWKSSPVPPGIVGSHASGFSAHILNDDVSLITYRRCYHVTIRDFSYYFLLYPLQSVSAE